MNQTRTVDARDAFDDLDVGDTIEVPQYKNALRVNHDGRDVGMLGVEFAGDNVNGGTTKHLIQNQHSGRVYLIAGTTDKGPVDEITVVG